MDMLNRLKSTVGSAVGAVMGNPVMREYEVTQHIGSGGPACMWKIYQATKRSTRQEAAVFVFEKKMLERFHRKDRDAVLEIMRKGPTQLTRLRHPCLLTVQHPLEESRESLAFATEPVFASLANILGNHDNVPSPLPTDLKDHKLYEVEIKYGLLQLTDGLKFLHNDVRLIHGNISPESVILNNNGAWKLAAFNFCIASSTTAEQPASYPMREWIDDLPPAAQPKLDYMAPEYILTMSCDTASDMFSLGMLMYSVMNRGKSLYECNDNVRTYKKNCEQLRCLNMNILGSLPDGLKEYVKMLLSSTPTVRPDADQVSKIPFFDDVGSMTLQYLDSIFQRDNLSKSQFFKGLPKVLKTLPKRVIHQRVLPALSKSLINPDMIPFVLTNILMIAEECTDDEYIRLILPDLKPVFKVQEPVQVLLIFMQKMDLLLTKTPKGDVKDHVLPMVYRALEAPAPQIQEMCLTILPTFSGMIDYVAMKHSIVPRIKRLCLETDRLSVRVGCLVCIGKMMSGMDKWFIIDEVIPMLLDIPSKEPAVLMGSLGIIKTAMTHKKLGLTRDVMATKLLPYLCPLCIENGLNLPQFNAYTAVIKEMVRQIEVEQRAKLEQITSMQQEHKTAVNFTPNGDSQQLSNEDPFTLMENKGSKAANKDKQGESSNEIDSMFKSFGLGNYMATGSEKLEEVNKSGSSAPTKKPLSNSASQKVAAPNEVSLSLAEKQRLQKEQEFQERMKKQKPIHAEQAQLSSSTKSAATDLTHTLLDSTPPMSGGMRSGMSSSTMGMSTMSSMNSGSTIGMSATSTMNSRSTMGMSTSSNMNSTMRMSATSNMNNTMGMSYGSGPSYGGSSGYGGGGLSTNTQPVGGIQSNTSSKPDSSAFDNLLGPQFGTKAKPSLNQISSGGPNMNSSAGMMGSQPGMMGIKPNQMTMQQQGMYPVGAQGMMGNQGIMGSQGMMGNWQGNQMGGSMGKISGAFDPLAPAQQSQQQKKSNSLLEF